MKALKGIFEVFEFIFICLGALIIELPLIFLLYTAYFGYCIWELIKFIFKNRRCY